MNRATRYAILFAMAFLFAQPSLAANGSSLITGQPAPVFSTEDINAKKVDLAAFKGKVVVLEWTNFECPYVQKHYGLGNIQMLQRIAARNGYVWLTINSSGVGNQGYLGQDQVSNELRKRQAKPNHYIRDTNGELGHMYNVRNTPTIIVIKEDGTLAYMGAIDNRPTTRLDKMSTATNYVLQAFSALKAGTPIEVPVTHAYGCSVKYNN